MLATMQSTVIIGAKFFFLFVLHARLLSTILFDLFLCDLLTYCSNLHGKKLVTSTPNKYVLWMLEVVNPKKDKRIGEYDSAQLSQLRLFLG